MEQSRYHRPPTNKVTPQLWQDIAPQYIPTNTINSNLSTELLLKDDFVTVFIRCMSNFFCPRLNISNDSKKSNFTINGVVAEVTVLNCFLTSVQILRFVLFLILKTLTEQFNLKCNCFLSAFYAEEMSRPLKMLFCKNLCAGTI